MALLLFGPARRKSAEATGTRARVRETSAREDGRALDGSRERARTVACSIRACASAGSGPRPRPWSPLRIFHVTRPRQQKQTAPRLGVVVALPSQRMVCYSSQRMTSGWSDIQRQRYSSQRIGGTKCRRSTPIDCAPIDLAVSRSTVSRESEHSIFDRHARGPKESAVRFFVRKRNRGGRNAGARRASSAARTRARCREDFASKHARGNRDDRRERIDARARTVVDFRRSAGVSHPASLASRKNPREQATPGVVRRRGGAGGANT